MTHVFCPGCRLRFAPAVAAYLEACPECGKPPQSVVNAAATLGFRLHARDDDLVELPEALSDALEGQVEVQGADEDAY